MHSKLVLGTVQFGMKYGISNRDGQPSKDTVFHILDYAKRNNILSIDTACAYGDSQELIGEYIKNAKSNPFDIISKFGTAKSHISLLSELQKICDQLHADSLYSIMFHSFEDYLFYRQEGNQLQELKDSGLIKKIGVSVYRNEDLETLTQDGLCKLVQLPFNMLDNNNQRKEAIDTARDSGIEIHSRSTFLQGLFFIPPSALNEQFSELKPAILQIQTLAKYYKMSIGEMALNYSLYQNHIDKVLIGVESVDQLEKNIEWSKGSNFSQEISNLIDEIIIEETTILNPSNWS